MFKLKKPAELSRGLDLSYIFISQIYHRLAPVQK